MTAAALSLVFVAACQNSDGAKRSSVQEAPAAKIAITPANGTTKTRPDEPIEVQVTGGKIKQVQVSAKGVPKVTGTVGSGKTTWKSKWKLSPDTKYRVTVTAVNADKKTVTAKSTFTTLDPKNTFTASALAPNDDETVGVGMPIMLQFSRPIANKSRVERALDVGMSEKVEGAWRWISDTEVAYRPKEYWPKGEKIELNAHLRGVRAARGVYGTRNLHLKFKVKRKVVVKASTKTHQLSVYKDGKKVRHWPISAGRGGVYKYYTTSGTHLAMGKSEPVWMTSPGIKKGEPGYYHELIHYAVRISNSGEFIHSMPSTVSVQGHANVSHGCVNSPPQDAKWFFGFVDRGDVVKITGSPRPLEWNNGWGFWQMPWKKWKKGSALD